MEISTIYCGVITHSAPDEVDMDDLFADWPQKKLEVVEAAITTIAREGFDRATTAKIAKQAKVGEGTIYRYFRNKDDLVTTAAMYTGTLVFGPARENFNPESSVHAQFIQFATDFLKTGMNLQLHHQFMEQYLNSPIGIAYRKRTITEVLKNPEMRPLFYPLNRILHQAITQQTVKDFPFQFLVALTMGPISFILKHSSQGFMELNEEIITDIAESCWASIRR